MSDGSGRRVASGGGTLAVHAALLLLLLWGREPTPPATEERAPLLVFDLPAERAPVIPPSPPEPPSAVRERSSGGPRPAPSRAAPITSLQRPSTLVATILPSELPAPSPAAFDLAAVLGELGEAQAPGLGSGGIGFGSGSGDGSGKGRARVAFRGAEWLRRPTVWEMERYWPPSARERRISGYALLACTVTRPGKPDRCEAVAEMPAGEGFGEAAVRMSELFRVRPVTRGRERVDVPVYIPVLFDALAKSKLSPGG